VVILDGDGGHRRPRRPVGVGMERPRKPCRPGSIQISRSIERALLQLLVGAIERSPNLRTDSRNRLYSAGP
jgi:hypothetical protein